MGKQTVGLNCGTLPEKSSPAAAGLGFRRGGDSTVNGRLAGIPGAFPKDLQMGGLAKQLDLADTKTLGEGVEPNDLGLGRRSDAIGAVAVDPSHMMWALARLLYEVPEEVLIRGR